jgi:hypothetical protein
MRKQAFLIVCAVVLSASASGPTSALKCYAKMDPIRVNGQAGQVVNRSFSLTLDKDEARTQFRVYTEDWWRSEDGSRSFYDKPGTLSRSCASWVMLNPVEATVDPGGTLQVRITITIPDTVKPGGYWCALTIDEVPDPLKVIPEGVGVRCLTSISTGIFVSVGALERRARVVEVRLQPDQALVKLRNEGNCPLSTQGRFEFFRIGESQPAATAAIARGLLLPEPIDTAIFSARYPSVERLPSGRYRVRVLLDIGLDHYIGVQKEVEIRREASAADPHASAIDEPAS